MPAAVWTYQGVTDERDTCDCCGRIGRKRTVALKSNVNQTISYFGTTCAARALGWRVEQMNEAITDTKAREIEQQRAQYIRKSLEREAEWSEFLIKHAGPGNRVEQIERLGGFGLASKLFLDWKKEQPLKETKPL